MNIYNLFTLIFFLILNCFSFSLNHNEPINLYLQNKSNSIQELNETINSTYMDEVISDLKKIMDAYVYSDISKNPPEPNYHIKINIEEELSKISTKNERPFYEFYRDVRKVLNNMRDYHLNIVGKDISFGKETIEFSKYSLCLPFKLVLDFDQNKEIKIFIKQYFECSSYYSSDILDFIKFHENVSLDKINNIDAFDYIQNFGKDFYEVKNPHAHFSYFIRNFHCFYLKQIPLTQNEIDSITLSFTDNKILTLNYHIIKPENIFNDIIINKEEFSIFFEKQISKHKDKNIFDIKNEFLKSKNLYNEVDNQLESDKIKWNYQSKNGELKCRVDEDNKLNIFSQNSFGFSDFDEGENIIYNCSKLFYSNNYRIIGIESNNLGGDGILTYIFTQLLQTKIDVKFHMAVKKNDLIKEYFNKNKNNFLDSKTCLPFENWDDFIRPNPDEYGDIKHYRSNIYDFVPKAVINKVKKMRTEFENEGKLKKPTDILIFTDSISYSATSFFIKNLQNTGGAIIAGYLGNPKNPEVFDSSQGPSDCNSFSWSNEYINLSKKGFEIDSLTFAESFEDDYQNEGGNPIPREYKINAVDERTNIYHYFDDSSYDEFIKEGKNIFKKYNENNKCNEKNLKLLYENDQCFDQNHGHGGYLCGEDGKWTSNCKIFYCDIGYYYNQYTEKCELDVCTTDIYIDINEEIQKEFDIFPDQTYLFSFNNNSLAYVLESPIEDIIHYPNFELCTKYCAIKDNTIKYVYVNYFKELAEKITIKVNALVNSDQINSYKIDSPKISKIQPINKKIINLIQVTQKNYFYADSYDNYAKIYFGEYNEEIEIKDILNINSNFFPESHGKILELNPDKIYVIILNAKSSYLKTYFYSEIPENINVADGNTTLLYLEKGKNYQLNFGANNIPFLIKLNPLTNSQLDISDNSGNKKTLNTANKYYNPANQIDEIYKGNLNLNNIQNDNALIEILYSFGEKETEILNERSINDKIISKKITLIEYSLQNDESNLEIYLKSNDYFKISVYAGTSQNNYFYYSLSNIPKYSQNSIKKYFIKLNDPLKKIGQLEENEKYMISLMFEKTSENQIINVSYYYNKNPINDLYEDLDKDYIDDVVSNLISIISSYAYTEIAQNPPQPDGLPNYNHEPIDLVGSLNNMKREGRKFYDFYREMREILGTVRDLHFRIFGLKTPSGIKLDQITACLPFSFYVEKDSNSNIKMFIKYFEDCAVYFTDEERNYIKERSDNKIALKYINNEDPFNYIQKWGRIYRGNKSPHAHFTLMKTLIHSFYIRLYPYTPEELSMSFEFETSSIERDIINLDYFIFIPNIQNMKLFQNFDNFNKNEFDIFFENELKKNNKENVLEPNIFEMIHKFKILKGLIKEAPKATIIDWTYQTPEENGIKCRVDEDNKVNIFVQGSFSIDDEIAQQVMYNCTRDFYKNNYRIIGIQNRDGGGWAHLCLIFHQLVQVKTQDRAFKASKLTEFFKQHVIDDFEGYVDVNTCKPFNNIDELFQEVIDDFSTDEKKLLHSRSQVFNYIDKDTRKRLQNNRIEFENYGHLKKPTDIIIYTDSFSYSATSSFIKGFQYTGGAIVVGFNGNPFIGKEQFDGSQSPASVTAFEFSDEYKNLDKLGIVVSGITFAETYDDYYIMKNPIPREYLLDPVDEIVDIYEPYTDDTYQIFINKAQEIFRKYNEDGYCNTKNKKLLLDPNNGIECYNFDDDEFAHGGYECGEDGRWSNICKKYYCDIGYYFNQYKQKCERDICANDPGEKDIYLNGEYNETIVINNENNMEYIFHINNSDYIYFFESIRGNGYIHYGYNRSCPNLCVVQFDSETQDNKVYLNYYRNATEQNIVVKISSIKDFKGKIISRKLVNEQINEIEPIKISKSIYIIESFSDYILYSKSIDNSITLLCTEYKNEMTKSDILNVNRNYFKECGGKINELNSNTIYIFSILSEAYNMPVEILLQPKKLPQNIKISGDRTNFLYLSSDIDYYLIDFEGNTIQRNIELSRLTINSELIIKEIETGEEVKINADNLYYTFNEIDNIFTGKIAIKVLSRENALIEFIFKYSENDGEILEDREYNNYKLSKKLSIIKFDKNRKNKEVYLSIYSKNEKEFKITMVSGYSKNFYYHYSKSNQPSNVDYKNYLYEITINNPDSQLEKDESFYLALIFDEKEIKDDFYYISLNKLDKYRIDDFNVEISEEKCNITVENVIKLMKEGYIYTEIIRNPPNPEYFGVVDLISDLKKVETKNRKYYDFFRDIRRIIGKMKDGHLNIVATNSPNGYDLKKMSMCLPFSFIVKGETLEDAKIYIEKYEDCFKFYNIKVQKFIENHLDIPLISIKGIDPFEYIQNIQLEFNSIHNKHGQFTRNINSAHKISINRNPLTKEQFSNIEFVFENNELITLDYYLYYVNPELKNNDEFINFYNKEIKKELNTLDEISILDVENKFYRIKNNIKTIKENNELEWDYSTTNPDGIQCRVDNINKVNVFKQKTFNFIDKEYDEALEVINNCTEAFYGNPYPIIGIESNNGGGIIEVSLYFQQFLQVKILQRTHFSTKVSDLMKSELEKNLDDIIELKKCEKFKNFDEMKEIVDDYGNNIEHHRTKIFELFNKTVLKEHKKRRQKYFNNYELKKPTEIIIFTDSFSYSSTSFFIKGLQETGAAIMVGYKGNPKSKEFFEASHSPSAVNTFSNTDIYNNLTECGFEIIGTTFFESFNYSYQEKNPIPREYLIHPVDERVNIFQNYDDSLYDKFVEEAKKIFKKYNEDQYCNKDNLKLVFDPNNKKDCYTFNNDKHAHGGYECDVKEGKWSDKCVPYYCDIGYYFDTYINKCIKDQCTEEEEDDDNKLSTWAIVLICISVVILLVVVAYIIYRFCVKKKLGDSKVEGALLDKNSKSYVKELGDKDD